MYDVVKRFCKIISWQNVESVLLPRKKKKEPKKKFRGNIQTVKPLFTSNLVTGKNPLSERGQNQGIAIKFY